jgi:drug/metabolite transporter (DMT)-like permease
MLRATLIFPMPAPVAPVSFSLGAVFSWGTSDFLGGVATRRASAFLLTTVTHLGGASLMLALAWLNHSSFPSRTSIGWAIGGGLCGGAALAIFYRALAIGKMGLAAPLTAVIAAIIPTLFGILTEGSPSKLQIAGFVLAGISIWLISRSEDHTRPEGLGLAVLAAIGFAGFFLCAKQAGQGSALWLAGVSRCASLVLTAAIVLIGGQPREINLRSAALGAVAGCLDSSGTALFIRASQTGRLDSAVVISSLYPAITVLLARLVLREHLTRWKLVGMLAALAAVALIAAP